MLKLKMTQQQVYDKSITISSDGVPVIPLGGYLERKERTYGNELSMAVNFLRSGCPAVQIPLLYFNIADEKKVLSALEKMQNFLDKLSTPSEVLHVTHNKNIVTVARHKKSAL